MGFNAMSEVKKTGKKKPLTAKQKALRAKRRRQKRIRRNIYRAVLSFFTLIAFILVAALSAGFVAFKGPSRTMGDLLTVSMLETSALKFVPRIYYNAQEMEAITSRNKVEESTEETDTSLIVIAPPTPEPTPVPAVTPIPEVNHVPTPEPLPTRQPLVDDGNGILIYEVRGGTYTGYMMVVLDPSRVGVGTCRDGFNSKPGLKLDEIAARYNAIAAVNGGGFEDTNGGGNGGKPIGLVVSNGQLLHKAAPESIHDTVVGFNTDNILVVGKFTTSQAKDKKLRDALAFGPALIVNGEPAKVSGASSGLNPRTAIGQRSDGAVLLLVIDGRQANSIGATYADLIDVMQDYGAVNAVNLDGGSSSMLYYNGEYLNNGVVLTGSRNLPTAFVVR